MSTISVLEQELKNIQAEIYHRKFRLNYNKFASVCKRSLTSQKLKIKNLEEQKQKLLRDLDFFSCEIKEVIN